MQKLRADDAVPQKRLEEAGRQLRVAEASLSAVAVVIAWETFRFTRSFASTSSVRRAGDRQRIDRFDVAGINLLAVARVVHFDHGHLRLGPADDQGEGEDKADPGEQGRRAEEPGFARTGGLLAMLSAGKHQKQWR